MALPHQGGKILAIAWEQIWELNSVKPLQISATGRKQADTRPCLTSACATTRASQNPWDTAHNPEGRRSNPSPLLAEMAPGGPFFCLF
jgi:hypothetical protein